MKLTPSLFALTSMLTLAACGGDYQTNGELFSRTPVPPPPPPPPPEEEYVYDKLDLTESTTFGASSVTMDLVLNIDDETDPTLVSSNGNATVHYDTSDGSFSIDVSQGNITFFHNFREFERDTEVTDSLVYSSVGEDLDDANELLYHLNLTKPGTARDGLLLNYMSFGLWSALVYPLPIEGWREAVGGIAFGNETRPEDMPTTGIASYTGKTVGILDENDIELGVHDQYTLAGDVEITANFDALTLNAFMNNMMRTHVISGVTTPWEDFHSSLSLTEGSNKFIGVASTDVPYLHGEIRGTFYGPVDSGAPAEVGGIWSLFDPGEKTVRAIGSFGAVHD
ncbi:hypothetical protein GCM10017044_21800 [Kordiimonas sediminis]|uniref:Transferrin-binding protein B C-lobe/N-lobe beta-barrel domain-containing protein n=1 Tax=Kordiimonas sediminis TaxID=1735581 RepID=A0A919E908_9PROT|nr:transferrin-binding protein-like solute binding protein [Kordiimonas sediminis]GHF26473.1 hypothetical protein GCM10017044_21800 [Kordiimonas sediminis]